MTVRSLVEIGPVVLEKKISFKFVNVFSQFRNYLPFKKCRALHLNKFKSHSPKDALCQVWLNWPTGSGEEDDNVKSLQTDRQTDRQAGRQTGRQTDRQTDDGRQVIRKAHLSFQLR